MVLKSEDRSFGNFGGCYFCIFCEYGSNGTLISIKDIIVISVLVI